MGIPSVGIRDLLVAAGLGTDEAPTSASTWPIVIGRMPDMPINCILLTDTTGLPSMPGWLLDYPTINIIVRATSYEVGYTKIKNIKDCIFGIAAQDINGDRWCGTVMLSDITYLGVDSREHVNFSCSIRAFIEPADTLTDNRLPL